MKFLVDSQYGPLLPDPEQGGSKEVELAVYLSDPSMQTGLAVGIAAGWIRSVLHLLYVGPLPPYPGGVAVFSAGLLAKLAALGFRVRALAPVKRDAPSPGVAVDPRIEATTYEIPFYETAPYNPPPPEFLAEGGSAIEKLLPAMIAADRPDVVMAGRESFARYVPEITTAHEVPCLLSAHGNPTTGILDGSYPRPLATELLEQFRKACLIVTPARFMAEGLSRLGLRHVRTIPNSVDREQFYPGPKDELLLKELNLGAGDIVVAHVSKLTTVKRPMDLVLGAEMALRRESRLLFLVVGDGPCRATMEQATRQKGIRDRFRFTGMVEHNRVADLMRLSDMVVMPSEREGQTLVYLESQACGRALLASDIPAARENIVDDATGILFQRGDVPDMTEKILRLAGDNRLRAEIGRQAAEYQSAKPPNDNVAQYVSALEAVAGGRNDR